MAPERPLWDTMDAQPRHPVGDLRKRDVPDGPGVYAWYRDGEAVYDGKATCLRKRVSGRHLGRGRVMSGSAFRRNVPQHLGIATSNDIYTGGYTPTEHDVVAVQTFVDGCDVSWVTTATESAAAHRERDMKREWMPLFTRM
jgi:hypothetical protein